MTTIPTSTPTMTEEARRARLIELEREAAELRAASEPPPWARYLIERAGGRWSLSSLMAIGGQGYVIVQAIGDGLTLIREDDVHRLMADPARRATLRALLDLADPLGTGR